MRAVGTPDWITVDAAYSAQLTLKAELLKTRKDDVLAVLPEGRAAADETLTEVLDLLARRSDFTVGDAVTRPDGRVVDIDRAAPLETLAQLLQEDICILEKRGEEHILTAACLCFPASWTLAEKIGRPLTRIHKPVAEYAGDLSKRVQRLFDGVKVGHPLWRANLLDYVDPALFHPRREDEQRNRDHVDGQFERSERQTIWRLPRTGCVVFAIHTAVVEV